MLNRYANEVVASPRGLRQRWHITPPRNVATCLHLLAAAEHHHAPATIVVEFINLEGHNRVHCGGRQFRSSLGEEHHTVIGRLVKDGKDHRQSVDTDANPTKPTGAQTFGAFCR